MQIINDYLDNCSRDTLVEVLTKKSVLELSYVMLELDSAYKIKLYNLLVENVRKRLPILRQMRNHYFMMVKLLITLSEKLKTAATLSNSLTDQRLNRKPLTYISLLLICIFSTFSGPTRASILYMDQLSLSIGMVMNNFSQVEDAINGEAKTGATDSMLSADLNYEIFQFRNMSHLFKMTGTGVLMNTIDKYYGIGYGVRWYFEVRNRVKLRDKVLDLQLTPKLRYYAGANIGGYYMVYRPEPGGAEIRNDIGVESVGMLE